MTERHAPSSGLLLVISGPSGAGKTSVARGVESQLDAVFSVSVTTRAKTHQDVEGRDYFFITEDEFKDRIERDQFLEHAHVFGKNRYGTPRGPVEEQLQQGRLVILEIDVQGGLQVRGTAREAFMVFVLPPSDRELLRRLRSRAREGEDVIQTRFAEAKAEIQTARESGAYDEFVVNENLEETIANVCDLVRARQACVESG